jgi:hypothetical protein
MTNNWRDKYDFVGELSEGRIRVQLNGKYGFVDEQGKVVVEPRYDNARDFRLKRAAIERDGKWGFLDPDGKEVIPPKYDSVGDFS